MTDTDVDIDPVLAAHLRRTFGEVAATVAAGEAPKDNVIRLVTAPVSPGRGSRWAWLGAAAAAGAVVGAGLMAVADRDTDQTTIPAASTVAMDGFGLSHTCVGLHGHADALDNGGMAVVFDPTTAERRPTVLVSTPGTFYTCSVSDSGDAVLTDWSTTGPMLEPPSPAAVHVLEVRAETSRAELVGPGRMLVIGRAGHAVDAIGVAVAEDEISSGQLKEGWFLVDAQVPADVPITEARLTWRVISGDEWSRRVDVLDDDTLAEACARRPGCVDAEIARLHDVAVAAGQAAQAEILADGEVTSAERVASLERFAACFKCRRDRGDGDSVRPGRPAHRHDEPRRRGIRRVRAGRRNALPHRSHRVRRRRLGAAGRPAADLRRRREVTTPLTGGSDGCAARAGYTTDGCQTDGIVRLAPIG